jgi:DNA polymerase
MLFLHLATYSPTDLVASGVYTYAASSKFKIRLLSYWFEDKAQTIDIEAGESIPSDFIDLLKDTSVIKVCHNANFMRVCLSKALNTEIDPSGWHCLSLIAARMGYARTLKELTAFFNGFKPGFDNYQMFVRNYCLTDDPINTYTESWKQFKTELANIVNLVRESYNLLIKDYYGEWDVYTIDQRINDKGVLIDRNMLDNAIEFIRQYKARLILKAESIMKRHYKGLDDKRYLYSFLVSRGENPNITYKEAKDPDVKTVLWIFEEYTRKSCEKYFAIKNMLATDNRVRGLLLFNGTHTGRWTSPVLHNIPTTSSVDRLDEARELVCNNDFDSLELMYGQPMFTLSRLIRTTIIPSEGLHFVIADFCNIEARLLAWAAGAQWKLDLFAHDQDIYIDIARKIFNVDIDYVSKEMRQLGKIAELALGFGAGAARLAEAAGISSEDAVKIHKGWRDSNPEIVEFWKTVQNGVIRAVNNKCKVKIKNFTLEMHEDTLHIILPTGNHLYYRDIKVDYNRISYLDSFDKRVETYGGKLVENIVSGLAREFLADRLVKLSAAGYSIVFHVHDEIVIETTDKKVDKILNIINSTRSPIKAQAFISSYYRK